MENIVRRVHGLLIKGGRGIAVAESCTGGALCAMLTELEGSSRYFILGVVAYSNRSKNKLLGIPADTIASKGAVSPEVAGLMAKKIRRLAKVGLGIAITGIAGPGGGSKAKPVGTVFIAIDSASKKLCKKFLFRGTRQQIRKKSALKALELLRKLL